MVVRFARRVVRSVGVRIAHRVGIDYVTGMRLSPRTDLERLGDTYGGWVIPTSLLSADSIAYCVGCGENISFDLALIERFGCSVHALDPTPRAVAYVQRVAGGEPRYHFEPIGLWDSETSLRFYAPQNPEHVSHSALNLQQTEAFIEVPVQRLRDVMARHGHVRLTVLKLDIEGAEYKVLQSVLDDDISVDVLCIEFDEFHHPLDGSYRQRIRAALKQLLARGYALVDAYAGNYTLVSKAARAAAPGG